MNRWANILAGLIAISALSASHGQTFNVLHVFGANSGYPEADLVLSGSTLYGTTANAVFKINTDGTDFSKIHSVLSSEGREVQGKLALRGATLYGTTMQSGLSYPYGGVFAVNTDGTGCTVLHSFTGGSTDGKTPFGGPVLSGSTLFGTTHAGGTSDKGTIYQINADGTGFGLLHSFAGGDDGATPDVGLTLSGSTLFGTTLLSGTTNRGTIFRVNTDGTDYNVLHSFTAGQGGSNLSGLTLVGSTLFGANWTGGGGSASCGTIFKMNVDGTGFGILHTFIRGANDGAYPMSGLTAIGSTLYGTTYQGGASDKGTIFQIDLDGTDFSVLHSFSGSDGAYPEYNRMAASGSTLYGMTRAGGPSNSGILFSLTVPEPSSLLLFGLGLIGLRGYAWRRRRSEIRISSSAGLGRSEADN